MYIHSFFMYTRRIGGVVYSCGLSVVAFLASASIALAQNGQLNNPLRSEYSTVSTFVAGALKALVMIALPIVAFFLVLAGFQYITAQGNAGKLETAHRNFAFVVIGGMLLLGAWVVATMIGGTVSQVVGN